MPGPGDYFLAVCAGLISSGGAVFLATSSKSAVALALMVGGFSSALTLVLISLGPRR